MKTPAEIAKGLKGFYETNMTALQGIMDKLPEGLRGELKKLYDDLNTQLAKLPPLEQVPAASEAAGSLNYLADCISRMGEYAASLMDRLHTITKSLGETKSAYQSLEDKVAKGELVTKEAATTLAEKAKDDGVKSVMPQIVGMRKSQVELAGLPEAPEAVLGGTAEEFKGRFDAANANVKALAAKGFKLGGKGAGLVKEMAWLPAQEFAGKLTAYSDILGGSAGTNFDPLLGGGTPSPDKKDRKATLLNVA